MNSEEQQALAIENYRNAHEQIAKIQTTIDADLGLRDSVEELYRTLNARIVEAESTQRVARLAAVSKFRETGKTAIVFGDDVHTLDSYNGRVNVSKGAATRAA